MGKGKMLGKLHDQKAVQKNGLRGKAAILRAATFGNKGVTHRTKEALIKSISLPYVVARTKNSSLHI